jgi:hypothetical protein
MFINGLLFTMPLTIQCSRNDALSQMSGCEVTEGYLNCQNLKANCEKDSKYFSQWPYPDAEDGIKCQCCENDD